MTKHVNFPDRLERVPLAELLPYARNSRTHSEEQVRKIAASMEEFGFTNPVLVDGEGVIVAGHGRVLAAKALGLREVPVVRLAHLSEAQRKAYVIADNRLALDAGWDEEMLRLELGALMEDGYDLALTGFGKDELSALLLDEDAVDQEGLTEDDAAPAPEAKTVSVLGDLWLLGDHRLLCGDSTDLSAVERLCDGVPVDLCWTDPPYNVSYEGSAGKIKNDNMGDEEFKQLLLDAFISGFAVMRPGAPMYIAHADLNGVAASFISAFKGAGFHMQGTLVWAKPQLVLGRFDYQARHEPILYGWKPGAAHSWYGGRKLTTVFEAKDDLPFRVAADGSVTIEAGSSTLRISGTDLHVEELVGSVLRAEKPKRSAEHPTMKPVELVLGMLKNSSRRGDVVLDLFGGSGTTLIAAQKCDRKARLMELDPRFVDVIVKRWQDFTGKKAVHAETGELFDAMAPSRLGSAA